MIYYHLVQNKNRFILVSQYLIFSIDILNFNITFSF